MRWKEVYSRDARKFADSRSLVRLISHHNHVVFVTTHAIMRCNRLRQRRVPQDLAVSRGFAICDEFRCYDLTRIPPTATTQPATDADHCRDGNPELRAQLGDLGCIELHRWYCHTDEQAMRIFFVRNKPRAHNSTGGEVQRRTRRAVLSPQQ